MNQEVAESGSGSIEKPLNTTLIIICMGFQTLGTAGITLFMPIIRGDLEFSFTQGGMLSAATCFIYALMQIPAGFFSDRYGINRILFIGVLGSTLL